MRSVDFGGEGEGGRGNTYHWPPYLRGKHMCSGKHISRGNTYHCDIGSATQLEGVKTVWDYFSDKLSVNLKQASPA